MQVKNAKRHEDCVLYVILLIRRMACPRSFGSGDAKHKSQAIINYESHMDLYNDEIIDYVPGICPMI